MKTPFTCHILIPEDLRVNPLFQIPEGIKQELTCEYYQTVSPKMMECGHAIQLVVLHEEAFESWRQFKIPQKLTTGVFLLDGETGNTLPSSEVVMAWVNPATISKRRWNYLFQQCLLLFDVQPIVLLWYVMYERGAPCRCQGTWGV